MKKIFTIVPRQLKNTLKKNKADNSPNNFESRELKLKTIKGQEILVDILRGSRLNDIQEKRLNKNEDMNIKMRKYPSASLTNILEPYQTQFKKRTKSNFNSCWNKQPNEQQ